MSETKRSLQAFLSGLDSNDNERLVQVGLAAFEEHANSFPGPDKWAKDLARPHVKAFIESILKSLTQ
jgi:hypothetical protein